MNIVLKFDYYTCTLYVPDGYVHDMDSLCSSFFAWMQDQPDCIINSPNRQLAFSYDENDFLTFVNDAVLVNSKEKAYFVNASKKRNRSEYVIEF